MARPIFGGKKIDAPVFCQVWLLPTSSIGEWPKNFVSLGGSILYYRPVSALGAFVLELQLAVCFKECYSGEDKNRTLFL